MIRVMQQGAGWSVVLAGSHVAEADSSHNTEQKRCVVRVDLMTILPSGTPTDYHQVFDAMEGGRPLASLNVYRGDDSPAPKIDLEKANAPIPPTPDNLAWFNGLMSK